VNRCLLLLAALVPAALAAAGCSSLSPYVTTVGVLKPPATLTVRVGNAPVSVFAPAAAQHRDLFTISATAIPKGTPPPPPRMMPAARGVVLDAPNRLAALLVRVPDGVNVAIESRNGDVNVTDITGNARVAAAAGNVTVMLPGYAQAAVGRGNLSITMGATRWPGTLHFSSQRGDIALWISGKAACTVHLHTDDGTLFTDFGLLGVSSGRAETIDGNVNGGGASHIDVEATSGAIRLLRLQPQP
jgi:hypothetical protein